MTKQLKYNIFCSRKRFNILSWLKIANDKTYSTFCDFLKSRNVMPPDEDYFNRALRHFISTNSAEKEIKQEDLKVDSQEVLEKKEELVLPEAVEETKEVLEEPQDEKLVIPIEENIEETDLSVIQDNQLEIKPVESDSEVKKTSRRRKKRKQENVDNEN